MVCLGISVGINLTGRFLYSDSLCWLCLGFSFQVEVISN